MASEKIVMIKSADDFADKVLQSDVPVFVDFWATWCGPCRMVGPIVDQLADEYEGKVKICKVDVDGNQELSQMYQVMSIPTLMVFKGGNVVDKKVGAAPKQELVKMIEKAL